MHNSSCPKCGVSFSGEAKTCGSCGAVSPHRLISVLLLISNKPTLPTSLPLIIRTASAFRPGDARVHRHFP
ncbi:hypothetical protein F5Y12DRAFT_730077 [Xylaria sp. FL1777]|nr:hypothetical protein F5Y12DRAFT_730077 [Xylaria sp. FL1777]